MSRGKRIRVSLALAAAVAGAGVLWAEGVWPHVAPKNFGVVHVERGVEGGAGGGEGRRQVYRSGELTVAATAKLVERYGIRTIVDLGAHEPGTPEERIAQKTAEALGVRRYRLDLEGDATGDPNEYVKALRILTDPEAQPVLVHCAAGAERTGCIAALYRQVEQGWDDDLAYAETKNYGHSGERNPRLRHVLDFYGDAIIQAFREGGEVVYEPEKFLRFEAGEDVPLAVAVRPSEEAQPGVGHDDAVVAEDVEPAESGAGHESDDDRSAPAGGM